MRTYSTPIVVPNSRPDEAKYLLLRLSLRKEGKWHSFSGLDASYHADLGPRLRSAMRELSGLTPAVLEDDKPRVSRKCQPTVIDLTLDDDDYDGTAVHTSQQDPTVLPPTDEVSSAITEASIAHVFAHGETSAELPDLLQCLNKDQLKVVATQLNIANVNKKNVRIVLSAASKTVITDCSGRNSWTACWSTLLHRLHWRRDEDH